MIRRRLTKKRLAEWFLSHGRRCHICGGRIGPGEAFDREHVIPLAAGGSDDLDNQRPAHRKCHKAKTAGDRKVIAKVARLEAAHLGVRTRARSRFLTSRDGPFKQKLNGRLERR